LRIVSVLFIDLVGFTALSEARDAEGMRELLGRYYDSARTIVTRYGGAVEKFIGDAVMAVWGAPVAREDDSERAVRAALEIVDAVAVLGSEVGTPSLAARAGVVTGRVAAVEAPQEGLVVGDRVNTASRVQSTAAPGTVLVDDVTRQVTMATITYADAGEHAVKGKQAPLRLWRALRVEVGARGETGLQAPFVGRDSDLRLLKDLLHGGVERGVARLVAVTGAAGVGKSRLRRELESYVDGLAGTFLWHSGRCLSYGDGVAYWALAEMVRQRLGIPEDAALDETEARLAAGIERWVPDATDRAFISPRLGALLGVAEPGLERAELFAGWRLFLERLAAHEPVVLVFEDVQAADRGMLDFIEHLLEWSADWPIFVMTLARPDLHERQPGWPGGHRGVTQIELEPLDREAVGELLDGLVDGLPARARDRIVAQAQGIPLYAIETVRSLGDRGVLVERDGRLALGGELGELEVPASLSSLLASRLDALPPDERELVKATAVFGGTFPRSAAGAVGGANEADLERVLSSLVRKQVLTIHADPLSPDRGQYAFAQDLLRTVAYEMMSRRERKPRHLAAAAHLRQSFPNHGEDVAEVIAAHYLDAYHAATDDPDAEQLRAMSLAALRRAAQRAATVGAPDAAERAFRSAVALAGDERERTELTEAAGKMALLAGRYATALGELQDAADAHRAAGRDEAAARLADQIGLALQRLGRMEEAIERLTAALEVLGADELDPEVAALNSALGRALIYTGRYEQARPPLDAALRAAQALELRVVLCDALNNQAIIHGYQGRHEEARILLEGVLVVATEHHLSAELARTQANLGGFKTLMDMPGALENLEASLGHARRIGDRGAESFAVANLMFEHLLTGRWDEVDRLGAESLGDDGEGPPDAELLHCRLGALHALRGELGPARDAFSALAGIATSEHVEFRAMRTALLVKVLLAEGGAAEALAEGTRLLDEIVDTFGVTNEAIREVWPETLDAALTLGRLEQAHALVDFITDQPPGHVPPFLRAHRTRGQGLLAAAEGRSDTVEASLRAAVDSFAALGYRYWLARAETDLAVWLIDRDRRVEAIPLLERAADTQQSLGAAPALAHIRRLMAPQSDALVR
jgi:class 3 adenylate cyclase/tetratricopeptide (TPR) repeat protein